MADKNAKAVYDHFTDLLSKVNKSMNRTNIDIFIDLNERLNKIRSAHADRMLKKKRYCFN